MEFKGTKGKWSQKFEGCEPSRVIRSDNGNKEVAQIYRYNSESEQKANALLISKAPEMLEMLQKILEINKHHNLNGHLINEQIEQLIKQATVIE